MNAISVISTSNYFIFDLCEDTYVNMFEAK